MKNVFFPEDEVTVNDLYFVCYMIERIARRLKQPNKYVANAMGRDEIAKKLSLADVLHSENPLAVEADWIVEYDLSEGSHDVTDVDPELCNRIPTATQMAKVYKRLILATQKSEEEYPDAILRVYSSPICETLDNYNCSAYYEPSSYITQSYYNGFF